MASSPPQADISVLLNSIASAGKSLCQQQPGAREELLRLTYSLAAALETPSETIQRIGWAEPARFAAAQVAVDLKLFEKLADNDATPVKASQLADSTESDVALITRTMKHLAAMNVVAETGPGEYTATPLSNALAIPKYRDGITYCFNIVGLSLHKLPAYLKKTSYKNPFNGLDGPFQYAHDTKLPVWAWLNEHPDVTECFNSYMSGYRQGRASWMDPGFYPVAEKLGRDLKGEKDAVLLVDVGGGLGHDLEEFKAKHPHISGRLVLQDRPDVIQQIKKISPDIEAMAYDFFTPQVIQGAKAYYLHSVLHAWDDEKAREILGQLIPAMQRGYSKILINESVVPDVKATWSITSLDWVMMAMAAVRERTEREWHELLKSVGLRIVKIWTYEQGTESLIEVELDGE